VLIRRDFIKTIIVDQRIRGKYKKMNFNLKITYVINETESLRNSLGKLMRKCIFP